MDSNQIMATVAFKPSLDLMLEFYDLANDYFSSFNLVGGITWLLTFEPLAAAMLPKLRINQDSVLGLGPEDNGFSKFTNANTLTDRCMLNSTLPQFFCYQLAGLIPLRQRQCKKLRAMLCRYYSHALRQRGCCWGFSTSITQQRTRLR